MRIWAVVPMKPLDQAKSRLAPVLSPERRRSLSRRMFTRTLSVLARCRALSGTLVVSQDPEVLALAHGYGAAGLSEWGHTLNAALEQARQWVRQQGGDAVLILLADLPLLAEEDVEAMVGLAQAPPIVVLAPCRRDMGTNALLLNPLDVIPLLFGRHSFVRHCRASEARGIPVVVYRSDRLGLDVDDPADLAMLLTRRARRVPLAPHGISAYNNTMAMPS